MSVSDSHIDAVVAELFPTAVEQLTQLVAIPSVSWPSFPHENVTLSAEAVAQLARGLNFFDSVNILHAQTESGQEGNPAVVARRQAQQGFPTVLLYAHHDVQPPGDEKLWATPPFSVTERSGRLYGRGAADDKAGVLLHLTALKAVIQLVNNPRFGVVLFVEGEEEYGSPSFTNFLNKYRDELTADVIIVADSGNWDTSTPAITTTLRGNVTFTLKIETLDHALHSGMFGGVVPDAFMVLSSLVSSFYNPDGSVAVMDLKSETSTGLDYSEERMRQESGLLEGVDFIGNGDVLSRVWSQPSITVTGIDFPTVEHASNTLSPHLSARVSVRVAPGQRAEDALVAMRHHIDLHTPFGARCEIVHTSMGEGFSASTQNWAYGAMKKALASAFQEAPVDMGVGGSIPFISEFVETFPDAHVLVTGVEDPDSRAHSPNESLDIQSFKKAITAQASFFLEIEQNPVITQE